MGKKHAIVAGLILVVLIGAFMVLWLSLRTRPPEQVERESPSRGMAGRSTPEERKQTAAPQEELKSRAGEEEGRVLTFASASWIMEQQRIDASGWTKETTVSKVWIKGDKKRVETFRRLGSWAGGALQPTTVLFSDGEYEYSYYPAERRILKIPRAWGLESLSQRWVRQRSEERIGSEVVDGKRCETYRLVNDVNVGGIATVRMEVKECRWRGLVLKSVSRPLGSSAGDTYITTLKDVRLDVPIADERFELPTGVRIEELDMPAEALQ